MAYARSVWKRVIVQIMCVLCLFVLGACSSKPPQPTELAVSFEASAHINPDSRGRASPVVVRFYQLKNLTAFNAADFFSLYERDQDVLGADLVGKEEFQFTPGEKKQLTRTVPPEMCCFAVLAAFRDLEHSQWRAVAGQFKPNQRNEFLIRLDANSVRVETRAAEAKEKQDEPKKDAENKASEAPLTGE